MKEGKITLRSVLLGAFFAAVFAVLTVILINRQNMFPTGIQIPLFPYVLLLLTVLLLNPLSRLIRAVRGFSTTEILIIFTMGVVSAGISSFGLITPLVPLIGSLFNRHWNNEQSEWSRYVAPFLNESFFIAEPGIRDAAREYRSSLIQLTQLRRAYDSAMRQDRAGDKAGAAVQHGADPTPRSASPTEDNLPPGNILKTHPALIASQQAAAERKKEALLVLEAKAFERVELFRRGLPRGQRAFPGCLPIFPHDDSGSYFARIQRLICGKRAARHIRESLILLGDGSTYRSIGRETSGQIADLLRESVEALAPAARTEHLEETKTTLAELEDGLSRELLALATRRAKLNEQKRYSDIDTACDLEETIAELHKRETVLRKEEERASISEERNLKQLGAATRVADAADAIRGLREQLLESGTVPATEIRRRLTAILLDFPAFDASLSRFFLGDVPWSHWARPLAYWMVLIGITYVVLMAFNVLIFRQWAYNEKIVYPLAQLPQLLVGSGKGDTAIIPDVFRSGLFWAGFAVSSGVLGWNLLCNTEVLPGLKPLDLTNSWRPYLQNTALAGLAGTARSSVFFTLIAMAFLIPKKVSFSLWFFWVMGMVQLLIMVWAGYGQNAGSFPAHWWYTMNFLTGEGGGALIVFSSAVLWKCRKYLLCAFSASSVADLERDERQELRISSFLFLSGSLGIVLILWRVMGSNLFCAVFAYAIMLLTTIGLVRAVAEGGILSCKAFFGTFHFIRNVFGFDKPLTSTPFIAPLMTYYSVLFLDIKTFIAPAMANSLKIRDDLRMRRGKFHIVIILCIVVAIAASIVASIMMSYASGADSMNGWFYTGFPQHIFERIASMGRTPPTATASGRLWLAFGALLMAALLFFRRKCFWIPHPIGLIMLINPIMRTFWFSIFLGWIAKALVTRYGNKQTYLKTRGMFVGMIVGELLVVTVAMVISLIMGKNLGIDLNRN